MASPRKKIEQSTGRILRISPDKRTIHPIIVDIIDQHDVYVRQWYGRRSYYKQCAYYIQQFNKLPKNTNTKTSLDNINSCIIALNI
jgi:hypothetical protein